MIKNLLSFFLRDIRQAKSYRMTIFFDLASTFLTVTMFFFLSDLIKDTPALLPYGAAYFPFVLVGLAFSTLQASGLRSFAERLRHEQITGTLESVFSTPVGLSTFLVGSNLWGYAYALLEVLLYFGAAVIGFGLILPDINIIPAFAAVLLSLTAFMGMGIFVSALFLRYRCGHALTWFLIAAGELFGGVFFPVSLLPQWMQSISEWIPMHHALEALRLSLLSHGGFAEVGPHLWYLAGFTAFLWPIGFILFTFSYHQGQKDGALGKY